MALTMRAISIGHHISLSFSSFQIGSIPSFLLCFRIVFLTYFFFFPLSSLTTQSAGRSAKHPPPPPCQLIFALHRLSPAFAIHPAAARSPLEPLPLPSMGQDTNSATNDSRKSSSSPSAPHHRRGYQACDPCRKRKVKCDLGSMRSATPPPSLPFSPRNIRRAIAD